MQRIESYQRPAFLKDHPPVLARMSLASGDGETTFLAGTVLGRDAEGKLGAVTVPASGGASADVYVHASVAAQELIFADGVSAEDEKAAIAALRAVGVYA